MHKFFSNLGHSVAMFTVCWVFFMLPAPIVSLYKWEWWDGAVDLAIAASIISFMTAFAYGFLGLREEIENLRDDDKP